MNTLLGYTLAALDDELCDDRGRAYYHLSCDIRVLSWAKVWVRAQDAVRDFLAKYPDTEAMIENVPAWWTCAKIKKPVVRVDEYLKEDGALEILEGRAATGVRIFVRTVADQKIQAEVYIRPVVTDD